MNHFKFVIWTSPLTVNGTADFHKKTKLQRRLENLWEGSMTLIKSVSNCFELIYEMRTF